MRLSTIAMIVVVLGAFLVPVAFGRSGEETKGLGDDARVNLYLSGMICVTVLIGLGTTIYAVTRNESAAAGVFRSPNSFRGGVVFVVVLSAVFLCILDKYSGPIGTLFGTIIGFVLSNERHARQAATNAAESKPGERAEES